MVRAGKWGSRRTRLHFLQEVPTHHNNTLLKAILGSGLFELIPEYANRETSEYPGASALADVIVPARIFGSRTPSLRVLAEAIFRPRDRWLLIAWSNPTTRMLIVWFWISRKRFNCWIDVPPPASGSRDILRRVALGILKRSRVQMFAVGTVGVRYLEQAGFRHEQIHNLPIVVDVPVMSEQECQTVRIKFNVGDNQVLLVSGSRFVLEKGFDVLLKALELVPQEHCSQLITVIVGRGPERQFLEELADRVRLHGCRVLLLDWMDSKDLLALFAASDLVVHPSRRDSYGGSSIFARAYGKPLLASRGAGSALDIIHQGENGWLYDPDDLETLSELICDLVTNDSERERMAQNMRARSSEGSAQTVADVFLRHAW